MNPYDLLKIPKNCTDPDIVRKAWRKYSIRYHPDHNRGKKIKKFIDVQNAYQEINETIRLTTKIKDKKLKKIEKKKYTSVQVSKEKSFPQETIEDTPIPRKEWTTHVSKYTDKRSKGVKIKDVFKFGRTNVDIDKFNTKFDKLQETYKVISYKPFKVSSCQTSLKYYDLDDVDHEEDEDINVKKSNRTPYNTDNSDSDGDGDVCLLPGSESEPKIKDDVYKDEIGHAGMWAAQLAPNPMD